MRFILLSFLIPNLTFAGTPAPASLIHDVLEMVAYRVNHGKNLGEFVSGLNLPADKGSEIDQYLKRNKLESAPLPSVWVNGDSLVFTVDEVDITVVYKRLPKLSATIGSRVIEAEGQSFEDLVEKTHRILLGIEKQKTALLMKSLFLPEAEATPALALTVPVAAAIAGGLLLTADQISACSGAERVTRTKCHFRSNVGALKSIFQKGELEDFKCIDGQLSSVTQGSDWGEPTFSLKYDEKGNVVRLEAGFPKIVSKPLCIYEVKNSKIVSSQGESILCKKEKGMTLDRVHYLPLVRMMSCCKDKACETEMHAWLGSSGGQSSPHDNSKATQ